MLSLQMCDQNESAEGFSQKEKLSMLLLTVIKDKVMNLGHAADCTVAASETFDKCS